jgi:phosphate acetyltransferase
MTEKFTDYLYRKAKANVKRILCPESDERVIEAARICAHKEMAHMVIFSKTQESKNAFLEVIDPDTIREEFVEGYFELRKHKNITLEDARGALKDDMVLATMMLKEGRVDGVVAGASTTTADTIRPAFQLIKAKKGFCLISSCFFMCFGSGVKLFADCAVNPNPDASWLAEIAIQTAETAEAFDMEAKIAMISYSTGSSGKGEDVEKVRKAVQIVKEKRADLVIDGPLQYDAAINASIAKKKAPESKVAGQANILIFPDLNTGNATYKAVQQSSNIVCIGPLLQGLNKSVNDLSRGATVEDVIYTIALTSIQS